MFFVSAFMGIIRLLWPLMVLVVLLSLFTACGKDKPKSEGGDSTSSNTDGGTPTPSPPSRAYMWTTSTTYAGNDTNLRNAASADAVCAARAAADASGLPAGVTAHKAILSRTGGAHPNTFIGATTDIYRPDNTTMIVNDYADFFDNTAVANIPNPVNTITGNARIYWIGLNGTNCNSWTSNSTSDRGNISFSNATDNLRYGGCGTGTFCNYTCNLSLTLLCLSYRP